MVNLLEMIAQAIIQNLFIYCQVAMLQLNLNSEVLV